LEPANVTGDPSLLYVATISPTLRNFIAPYAIHFRELGWRVMAAANGATADPAICAAFDDVYELPLSRSIRDVSGLARSSRALTQILHERPDIVHVHTPIAGFLTRYAVRRLPRSGRPRVVYTAHGFHFNHAGNPITNAVFLTAERVAGRWTDRLVVINDEDESAARRHRIVPGRRLVRMPGIGVDTGRFAPSAVAPERVQEVREHLAVGADSSLFAVVGELNRNKRQVDALAALSAMRNPGAHMVLLGTGPRQEMLEGKVAELGLADRVDFTGFVEDVRPFLRAADALILPSKREGLARSVMEALSLETPVIASTARGNRELVGADSGVVYETGDVAALAAAMDRILEHPDEATAMGRRGRQRMIAGYDLGVVRHLHEELYRRLLEGGA
jgi:glycosyltransferase involved in cell wall biosynthesis